MYTCVIILYINGQANIAHTHINYIRDTTLRYMGKYVWQPIRNAWYDHKETEHDKPDAYLMGHTVFVWFLVFRITSPIQRLRMELIVVHKGTHPNPYNFPPSVTAVYGYVLST